MKMASIEENSDKENRSTIPTEQLPNPFSDLGIRDDIASQCVRWVIDEIIREQFGANDGEASGAWSRSYAAYLEFYFGSDTPGDVSAKHSISFSSWVVRPVLTFSKTLEEKSASRSLLHDAVSKHLNYLVKHQDPITGGYGLQNKVPNSTNDKGITIDIRHTVWAMLSLYDLNEMTKNVPPQALLDAGTFIGTHLEKIQLKGQRTFTLSGIHQLLTTKVVSIPFDYEYLRIEKIQAKVEEALLLDFDSSYATWDLEDRVDPERIKIVSALLNLESMSIDGIKLHGLRNAVDVSIDRLCGYLIRHDDGSVGLPFVEGDTADIGVSIQLFSILSKNKCLAVKHQETIKSLALFIFRPQTWTNEHRHGYAWQLAQLFNYKNWD